MSERILRLYPTPVEEVGNPYEDLELPPEGGSSSPLPYVIINMVTSIDGRVTTAQGGASRIGSAIDRRAMRVLRSRADAVMIGAGTLRAEKLSLGLDDPAAPQPLAVVVSNTADLPFDENLIRHSRQTFILVTTQRAVESPLLEGVLRVPATPSGEVDLGAALKLLKTEYAVEALLVEGGPRLNHALISQGFADELFLTLAPKLLGGTPDETLTILHGSALESREVEVLSVHLAANELFLRYALGRR